MYHLLSENMPVIFYESEVCCTRSPKMPFTHHEHNLYFASLAMVMTLLNFTHTLFLLPQDQQFPRTGLWAGQWVQCALRVQREDQWLQRDSPWSPTRLCSSDNFYNNLFANLERHWKISVSEDENTDELLHFRGLGKLMKGVKYQTQIQFMMPNLSNKYGLMKLLSPKTYALKIFYFTFNELPLKAENRVKTCVSMMPNHLDEKCNKSDGQGIFSLLQDRYWSFYFCNFLIFGHWPTTEFIVLQGVLKVVLIGVNLVLICFYLSFPGGKERIKGEMGSG